MSFKRITFFGLPLDVNGSADDICGFVSAKNPAQFINFIEPSAWQMAKDQPDYLELLSQMSLVIPSGQGVAAACGFFTRQKCKALSFHMTSFAKPFFKTILDAKATVALVGGEPRDDEDVQEKLKKYFPGIDIIMTHHGFGDFAPKVAMIMDKMPKVVIVSMISPRQEAFLLALRNAGCKGLVIGAGSFFETYMTDKDYNDHPAWVDQYKLMPFYRLCKEPQRLWQRYVFQYYYFAFLVVKGLIGMLTEKRETVATQTVKK